MKNILKALWQRLEGNKTIIGSNIITILVACPIPEPYKTISIIIVGSFTGVAFADHVKKGYFRKDKGK